MKILLLGEFSAFYKHLKKGLEELGENVILASNQDSWKEIKGNDLQIYKKQLSGRYGDFFWSNIEPVISSRKRELYGYDIVQMVHPRIYTNLINRYMFDTIRKNNNKMFLSAAGSDTVLYDTYAQGKLGYYIFDNNEEKCERFKGKNMRSKLLRYNELYVPNKVNGIIPIMYEYAVGYRNYPNCKPTIQLPFDASSVQYRENRVGNKIVIFHGLIREKDKGSEYIIEALNQIKSRYPNDVEIIIDGHMPLDKYLRVLENTNILLDQCKEHCWGMNACYAMALGKVVLGGASRNSLAEFNLKTVPIVHIKPDVSFIIKQLEELISRKKEIPEIGEKSRHFVEEFHNHIKIAEKYRNIWLNN